MGHSGLRRGLAGVALVVLAFAPPVEPASARAQGAAIVSPDIAPDGRVTFRLRAPGAREVIVRGFGERLSMHKDDNGVWTVTTDPLAPDIYLYSFVVDGTSFADPANPQFKATYPSGGQSLFHVPGRVIWEPAAAEHGAITRHFFTSAVIGDSRDYFVYTPPGYDPARKTPYPVLYLLHGLTDDASGWFTLGAANVILDNLIEQGQAVPMVVVCPLGYGTATMLKSGLDDQGGDEMMPNFGRSLLHEVIPRVEATYHVSKNRADRAIAGLSMGGAEALFVGLNHLETFAWVASFSGAYNMWPGLGAGTADADAAFARVFPRLGAGANADLRLLWLGCGLDDLLYGINERFEEWLTSRRVHFTDVSVDGRGHVWRLWRQDLSDLAPRLFRP